VIEKGDGLNKLQQLGENMETFRTIGHCQKVLCAYTVNFEGCISRLLTYASKGTIVA
jgi:hypothetical protein